MSDHTFSLQFLGTGTSVGVPMIGCRCPVCTSADPRNQRRRTSVYLTIGGWHIIVDTPPDFREQALTFEILRVDAVLITHAHADHLFGFDDIRRFNTIQGMVIPVFAQNETMAELRRIFSYIGDTPKPGVYRPLADFRIINTPFAIGNVTVTPLPVEHGEGQACGYRFDYSNRSVGFVPDCHYMPDSTIKLLQGVDVMVLDALRHRPHSTHFTVEESLSCLSRIGARRSYLIHLCHDLDHATLSNELPSGVEVSFDGLTVDI